MKNSITFAIACWGAALSTLVFIWDIYKWRKSKPDLKLTVIPNMRYYNPQLPMDDADYLMIKVANTGQRKTTIQAVSFTTYQSRTQKWKRKPRKALLVPNPLPGILPSVIDAGEEWVGCAIQTDEVVALAKTENLYCEIYHALSSKPVRARVII